MARPKKRLTDRPDAEVIQKLFPKRIVDKLREVAHEKDKKSEKPKDDVELG